MAGPHLILQYAVIPGMLVAVGNQHAKWRSRCFSFENTALYNESIRLLPLGAHQVFARSPAGHLFFDKPFLYRSSRRKAV